MSKCADSRHNVHCTRWRRCGRVKSFNLNLHWKVYASLKEFANETEKWISSEHICLCSLCGYILMLRNFMPNIFYSVTPAKLKSKPNNNNNHSNEEEEKLEWKKVSSSWVTPRSFPVFTNKENTVALFYCGICCCCCCFSVYAVTMTIATQTNTRSRSHSHSFDNDPRRD